LVTDQPPELHIRPYQAADLDSVYRVCLLTGESGEDATGLYEDPKALGHLYAGPYVTLEPELAFVLEDQDGVCGYVIGALDTRRFHQAMVERWLPPLQAVLPDPQGDREGWSRTERAYHRLHHPRLSFPAALEPYPSHLHIDLLPRAQGRGFGRRLMETLLAALAEQGSPGFHLGVGSSNARAREFYRKVGFVEIFREGEGEQQGIYLGRKLT
jgi:ribosomal protein S18 acetylase RimI-like enzyme